MLNLSFTENPRPGGGRGCGTRSRLAASSPGAKKYDHEKRVRRVHGSTLNAQVGLQEEGV